MNKQLNKTIFIFIIILQLLTLFFLGLTYCNYKENIKLIREYKDDTDDNISYLYRNLTKLADQRYKIELIEEYFNIELSSETIIPPKYITKTNKN